MLSDFNDFRNKFDQGQQLRYGQSCRLKPGVCRWFDSNLSHYGSVVQR